MVVGMSPSPRRRTLGHEPRNRKTLVYLTATEFGALETLAGRWGCTVSTLIRALCEIGVDCIEHHGKTIGAEPEPEHGRPPEPEPPDRDVLYPFGFGHDHG